MSGVEVVGDSEVWIEFESLLKCVLRVGEVCGSLLTNFPIYR